MKPAPQGTLAYWGRGLGFSVVSIGISVYYHLGHSGTIAMGCAAGLAWGLYEAYRGRQ